MTVHETARIKTNAARSFEAFSAEIVNYSDGRKGLLRFGEHWMRFLGATQLCFETSFRRFRRAILERTCFPPARRLSLETLSRVRRHERQSAPALRRAAHSRASKTLPVIHFAPSSKSLLLRRYGVGRGCGVGRVRGVTLGVAVGGGVAVVVGVAVAVAVAVGVAVGVAVAVGVGEGVGVGVGPAPEAQYLPPVLKRLGTNVPPQTIISLFAHTAV